MEITKERWWEADIHRIAGEIALLSPEPDAVKAEGYFDRALEVARKQQAKSWELRAAMSMARLWRDQGKRDEARELLAPVYGWFTEAFDTRRRRCLLSQDTRNAGSSDPSSSENRTGRSSLVVTLPFRFFSATTSC